MANKTLNLVPISSEVILENIRQAGYSIRRLAEETRYSERTIRSYLKRGEMPDWLVKEIDNIVRPKTHHVQMTLDIRIWLSDADLKRLMDLGYIGNGQFQDVILDSIDADDFYALGSDMIVEGGYVDKQEFRNYRKWYGLMNSREME